MLALFADSDIHLREVDVPRPGPGEALVRVRLAGICNTDLEITRGYMGFRGVLGHEFVGEVVEAESAALIGKRVNGEINLGCGRCAACARGLARHCRDRRVLGILGKDGCFAEYLTLPISNLVVVPDEVSDEQAVLTEPLAAAFEILEQVHVLPTHRVLVLGDGKLGLLCALVLAGASSDTHLWGKHEAKLAIAGARGIRTHRHPDKPEGPFDIVVEATGSPSGFEGAIEALAARGTLVLKSTFHGRSELNLAKLVIDEITVVGSRCGVFGPAHHAMQRARIDPTPLIQQRYELRDSVRALTAAAQPGVLKVLVAPG